MENYQDGLIESFQSFKLEASAEDVLKQIKKGNSTTLLSIATSAASGEVSGIISALVESLKLISGVTQYYNLKKYVELFIRLDEASGKDRIEFTQELNENPEFREQFCATVYLIVERVSELDKIHLISNLIIARTKKNISNEAFFRMMNLVDKTSWYDLNRIYICNCDSRDLQGEDIEIYRSRDKKIIENIMEIYGLIQIDQKIKEDNTRRRNSYGGGSYKPEYIMQRTLTRTAFGDDFIKYGFVGWKYQPSLHYRG